MRLSKIFINDTGIIHHTGIGAWPFVVCGGGLEASDLHPLHPDNILLKYADDTSISRV